MLKLNLEFVAKTPIKMDISYVIKTRTKIDMRFVIKTLAEEVVLEADIYIKIVLTKLNIMILLQIVIIKLKIRYY